MVSGWAARGREASKMAMNKRVVFMGMIVWLENWVWEDNVGGRGSSLWGRFFMIYQFLWEYRPRKKTIIHQSVLKFLFLKQKM